MKKPFLLLLLTLVLTGVSGAQSFSSNTAAKAGTKLEAGDMQGAVAVLTKAIEDNKDLYEAHLMRGNIRSMMGDIDGAIADYTAALEINPASAETYEKRAMYRKFKRDFAGALKDLDAAIANSKFPARVLVDRARIKQDLGDPDGALADYEAAVAHDANLASAIIGLAEMKQEAGDLDGAITVLEGFLAEYEERPEAKQAAESLNLIGGRNPVKRAPDGKDPSAEYLISTGVVNTRPSNQTPADAQKEAVRMEQRLNIAQAYATLGRFYTLKGDDEKALENIEKGLRISPQDPYGYYLRSEIRWKRNDLAGVIEDITKLINLPIRSPAIHRDKAILLTLQGRDSEALAEFEKHREMFPQYAEEKMRLEIERAKKLRETAKTSND